MLSGEITKEQVKDAVREMLLNKKDFIECMFSVNASKIEDDISATILSAEQKEICTCMCTTSFQKFVCQTLEEALTQDDILNKLCYIAQLEKRKW